MKCYLAYIKRIILFCCVIFCSHAFSGVDGDFEYGEFDSYRSFYILDVKYNKKGITIKINQADDILYFSFKKDSLIYKQFWFINWISKNASGGFGVDKEDNPIKIYAKAEFKSAIQKRNEIIFKFAVESEKLEESVIDIRVIPGSRYYSNVNKIIKDMKRVKWLWISFTKDKVLEDYMDADEFY